VIGAPNPSHFGFIRPHEEAVRPNLYPKHDYLDDASVPPNIFRRPFLEGFLVFAKETSRPRSGGGPMSVKLLIKGKGSFVPVIKSERTLYDVINQLDLDNVGGLVVTDDNHKILGIITEHDIARGLKNHGRNVIDRPLRDLMTRDVITVDINEPLTRVLELMDQHRIHYLPVTERGSLCGIINMLDLVKYRLKEIELEASALKDYVAGRA
jgi:CBS domain-containing protein